MATIDDLTQATTDLLQAVNVSKLTLDNAVIEATEQAGLATTNGASQVALATTQANTATAQALAATNQANVAAGYAASASSVVQQDLSAVVQALHRSPNAVTSLCTIDTSKDSVPDWIERMGAASWENEALAGAWLRQHGTELGARFTIPNEAEASGLDNWRWAVAGTPTLVAGSGGYFQNTETSGNYLTLADSSLNKTFTDLDIRVKANLVDWTPTNAAGFTSKYSSSSSLSYRFYTGSSGMALLTRSAEDVTVTSISTAVPAFPNGTDGWVRVTCDVDNGAGGNTVTFYTSTDGVTWDVLGAPVVNAGVTNISVINSLMTLGSSAGSGGYCNGKIYYLEVKNGIDGTTVAKFDGSTITEAATGDYFQLTTDGKFYSLNAGSGTTEVFRGIKRKFPKMAMALGSQADASVTIYDLTEPGLPMWKRFVMGGTASTNSNHLGLAATTLSTNGGSVYASGKLIIGSSTLLTILDFAADRATQITATSRRHAIGGLGSCNAGLGLQPTHDTAGIANVNVLGLAITVLPEAPVDPITGLKVPTIAVGTATKVSVIHNTGLIVNSVHASGVYSVSIAGRQLLVSRNTSVGVWYLYNDIGILGADFAHSSTFTPSSALPMAEYLYKMTGMTKGRHLLCKQSASGSEIKTVLLVNNFADFTKSLLASISNTYNTGYQTGLVKRCYMAGADGSSGAATGTLTDRSTKAAAATIVGTLTKAPVATGAQRVAYSGFSVDNYVREAYSADLDFGTAGFEVGCWCKIPLDIAGLTASGTNLLTAAVSQFDSGWTNNYTSNVTTNNGKLTFNGGLAGANVYISGSGAPFKAGRKYKITYTIDSCSGSGVFFNAGSAGSGAAITGTTRTAAGTYTEDVIYRADSQAFVFAVVDATSVAVIDNVVVEEYIGELALVHRSYSSGAAVKLSLGNGALTASAYDGTSTLTVTTANAYNTNSWVSVRAYYINGRLAISVDAIERVVATGAPLATLNNASAELTIGNNYAATAPFTGSIALVKLGSTIATPEQALLAYTDELATFAANSMCALPVDTLISDVIYDTKTGVWAITQATYSSVWAGLTRLVAEAVYAGSLYRVKVASGIKSLARVTTIPGVDITIPAYGLRSEIADHGKDLNTCIQTFDFLGGFTADTTTTAATASTLTDVKLLTPSAKDIGRVIYAAADIPTGCYITGYSGAVYHLSAAATGVVGDKQISFKDYPLPVGYTAKEVYLAGTKQKETTAWTRSFDGFKESITFVTPPAYDAWIQIVAVKEGL